MERAKTSEENGVWWIVENTPDKEKLEYNESIFSLGNGSLGFRGDFEEGYPEDCPGVYLNGFYESAAIQYGEAAYGYAENSQTMLNLANSKRICIFLDDEKVDLSKGTVLTYRRELSMREGVLRRCFHWKSPQCREIEIEFERMVMYGSEDMAIISCTLTRSIGTQRIRILSEIDGQAENTQSDSDPRVGSHFEANPLHTAFYGSEYDFCTLTQKTKNSKLAYSCAAMHDASAAGLVAATHFANEDRAGCEYIYDAENQIRLVKYIGYAHGGEADIVQIAAKARSLAKKALGIGIDTAREMQIRELDIFWENTGLSVQGEDNLTQGLHFNLFGVFGSVGRDGKTSIAAKGLSGEGYEGHYFWDTETYIFPMLLYTMPEIAKALLTYRYNILGAAKKRAQEMGHSGAAAYAWRTINGDECSAYYPAGSAQYHINADIANAVCMYAKVTNDTQFMREKGIELLIETARLWIKLGFYSEEKGGRFCINCVTGPDEYTVLVNNNCYTNMMAANNLKEAEKWCKWFLHQDSIGAEKLFAKTQLEHKEWELWAKASEKMYFPYDEERGVYIQDDDFYNREVWPIEQIPKENFPLLLHYHPLTIYRRRICKQADLVLALLLRGEYFTKEQTQKIYRESESLTTHDSSLSKAVFGIVASEAGFHEEAYRFFGDTVRMDLDDEHKNSRNGLHMANMAGAWMGIVYGFAGMRFSGTELSFKPHLPKKWEQYSFCVRIKECILNVCVQKEKIIYSTKGEGEISFSHFNEKISLEQGQSIIKNKATTYKGVIFDLDGVLCHTDKYHYRAWARVCSEENIFFDNNVNNRLRGISRMESVEIILQNANISFSEAQKKAFAERKNDYYTQDLDTMTKKDLCDGASELLELLKKKGIKAAIGSSSKNARFILKKLEIEQNFDAIVDGNLLEKSKPDPEVFTKAAQKLKLAADCCLVVEDARAGVEAALTGGFECAGLGEAAQCKDLSYTLQSLADLIEIL